MLNFSDWKYYSNKSCSTRLQDSKSYLEISVFAVEESIEESINKYSISLTFNKPIFYDIYKKFCDTNSREDFIFDSTAEAMAFINEFIIFLNKHMKLVAFL